MDNVPLPDLSLTQTDVWAEDPGACDQGTQPLPHQHVQLLSDQAAHLLRAGVRGRGWPADPRRGRALHWASDSVSELLAVVMSRLNQPGLVKALTMTLTPPAVSVKLLAAFNASCCFICIYIFPLINPPSWKVQLSKDWGPYQNEYEKVLTGAIIGDFTVWHITKFKF